MNRGWVGLSLSGTCGDGWASGPTPPQGNLKSPTSPRHHPCPYYDSEPLARPLRDHSKGESGCGRGAGTLVVPCGYALTCPPREMCQGERATGADKSAVGAMNRPLRGFAAMPSLLMSMIGPCN